MPWRRFENVERRKSLVVNTTAGVTLLNYGEMWRVLAHDLAERMLVALTTTAAEARGRRSEGVNRSF